MSEGVYWEEDAPAGALSGGEYAEAEDTESLPAGDECYPGYLRTPDAGGRTYGTLSYNAKAKHWIIRGDPAVCQMAKRLFPGCDGRGRGVARFAANRRVVGDLNWLMLRYPLLIKPQDEKRWNETLQEARRFARRRDEALLRPPAIQPPPTAFEGELLPFQRLGVGYLERNDRALLADEMGLGKTVQLLAHIASRCAYPALIVMPPHLRGNWEREIARFLRVDGEPPVVHTIRGLTEYELPPAHIYLCHYLLLRGWRRALPAARFKCVVYDEVQELRNTGTEKYSVASLIAGSCENVIGLSGTPIYNLGAEMHSVINIIDYHALGDFESFSREWCAGFGNRIVKHPELLGEHLKREGLMLRRLKDEVLKELPPKRRQVVPMDFDDRLYRQLIAPAIEELKAREGGADASARALLYENIVSRDRQATGIAKAPCAASFVRALVEGGERVLLFAHHHQVMDAYRQALKSLAPAFITGRESEKQKEDARARFMEGKTDLCVVSLRAAAGLNLQRASCVVFGELDWSPAVHSQAEDRAHRIGQRDSVMCYYLVAPQGCDQVMQEALGLKVSQFNLLMGDGIPEHGDDGQAARDFIKRVVDRLREAGE